MPTTTNIQELVAAALATDNEDDCLPIVCRMRKECPADDVIAAAKDLLAFTKVWPRFVGAFLLGYGGNDDGPSSTRKARLLRDHLITERSPLVIGRALLSLGWANTRRHHKLIATYKDHPSAIVRLKVAQACDPSSSEVVEALCQLTSDRNADVRDWACFQLYKSPPRYRKQVVRALRARLSDPAPIVREEAIHSLAYQRDLAVIPHLQRELRDVELDPEAVDNLILQFRDGMREQGAGDILTEAMEELMRQFFEKVLPGRGPSSLV